MSSVTKVLTTYSVFVNFKKKFTNGLNVSLIELDQVYLDLALLLRR